MKTLNKHSFLSWLKKQSPNRKFNYLDNDNCLIATYAKDELAKDGDRVKCGGTFLNVGPISYDIEEFQEPIAALPNTFTVAQALQAME